MNDRCPNIVLLANQCDWEGCNQLYYKKSVSPFTVLGGCNHLEKLMSVLPMNLQICLVKEERRKVREKIEEGRNHCVALDSNGACDTEVHRDRFSGG